MIGIKLKMSQQEMQVMAKSILAVGRSIDVSGMDSLLASSTLEHLFIRMYQSYAPNRDKFTFKLNLMEATVLNRFVLPAMMQAEGTLEFFVAYEINECICRKIDSEVAMYNTMKAE